ncbi:transporter [Camelimonas sp. ID_303_24]
MGLGWRSRAGRVYLQDQRFRNGFTRRFSTLPFFSPGNSESSRARNAAVSGWAGGAVFGEQAFLKSEGEAAVRSAILAGSAALSYCCMGLQYADATEGGASLYVPGLKSVSAGITPPQGFYFESDFYSYSGRLSADRTTQIGGAVLANLKVQARVGFLTASWVTPLEVLGGNLGFAATLPLGQVDVGAGGVVAAPRFGRPLGRTLRDSEFMIGDPVLTSFVGWHKGNFHWQIGASANLPSGSYRDGELANLSFNRVIGDIYVAATWLDPTMGLEITGVAGYEINGVNYATRYRSGNAFHADLAVTKNVTKQLSVSFLAAHYQQVTPD